MIADGAIGDEKTFTFYDFDGRKFRLVRSFTTTDQKLIDRLCGFGVPAFPSFHGL
jgi:hypothetical protein